MDFTLLKTNLEKLGYIVTSFENSSKAVEYLQSTISGKTIGIGGSMTIQQIGLYEKLSQNNEVYWHWQPKDGLSVAEMRSLARGAEIYFLSVNGIAETGEIVNIDGGGNRVAESTYGHKKVYFIVGKNKLEKDLQSAVLRAQNVAAPLNTARLNRKTPCAKNADKCYNCKSPERICRVLSIFLTKPDSCEYEVVLVDENLGY